MYDYGPVEPQALWDQVSSLAGDAKVDEAYEIEFGDDLASNHSEDEAVETNPKVEYKPHTKIVGFKFDIVMEFGSVDILRNVKKEHFIYIDNEYELIPNAKERFRAKYKAERCTWKIYASIKEHEKTFRIKTLTPKHECEIVLDNMHIDVNLLSKYFLEQFRLYPNMHYSAFKEMIENTKFSKMSSWQFYRAKKLQCKSSRDLYQNSLQYLMIATSKSCPQI
uniref:Transposase MuDR plant domain-containing protein n=1 Tax=Cannabis sativa TaxID=3483 RepID=A0A803PXV4_CANSA